MIRYKDTKEIIEKDLFKHETRVELAESLASYISVLTNRPVEVIDYCFCECSRSFLHEDGIHCGFCLLKILPL